MSSPWRKENGTNESTLDTFRCSLINQDFSLTQSVDPSLDLINCILNIPFSLIATMGNALLMAAIWKTPSLHTASNILLFGLALSDFAVGSILQPVFVAYRLAKILHKPGLYCATAIMHRILSPLLVGVSLSTLTTVSLDRYMALHLHLRYEGVVTCRRAVIVAAALWLFASLKSALFLWSKLSYQIVSLISAVVCIALSVMSYWKIYRAVCRQKVQMHAQLIAVANLRPLTPVDVNVNNCVHVNMGTQNETDQDSRTPPVRETGEAEKGSETAAQCRETAELDKEQVDGHGRRQRQDGEQRHQDKGEPKEKQRGHKQQQQQEEEGTEKHLEGRKEENGGKKEKEKRQRQKKEEEMKVEMQQTQEDHQSQHLQLKAVTQQEIEQAGQEEDIQGSVPDLHGTVPQPSGTELSLKRHKQDAVNIVYAYLLFVLCFLPYIVTVIAIVINGWEPSEVIALHFSATMLMINSSLNPVIFCWRMSKIREAMLKTLKTSFRCS